MITRRNPSIFLDDLHLPAVLQYCRRVPCPGQQDAGFFLLTKQFKWSQKSYHKYEKKRCSFCLMMYRQD